MESLGKRLAVVLIVLGGFFSSPVLAQPSAGDYPPPLDVPPAGSDVELQEAVADFWKCVVTSDPSRMEELASVIERTGIERHDPYLQARGLVRRAWADIHLGNWENRTLKKLAHARALTVGPPALYERREDYLIARSETLLFHGSLKNVFGLPGKPKGEVDIREGLALSWQTANNELLFFAHSFAFRAEYLRNRAISGLFLVVKAEQYAEMTKNESYISAARSMRFLAYATLSLMDSDEWNVLREDTLANFPKDSTAWQRADRFSSKLDDETIGKYLSVGRTPELETEFEFSIDVASRVVGAHLDGKVTEETLALTCVMMQRSVENNSEHSLFYSAMKKAEVLARLEKDDELFVLANEYYPKYMENGDYFLASRLAGVARLRAEAGDPSLRVEWRAKAAAANTRLRARAIPQATTAAEIALEQEQLARDATRLQTMHAQKQLEAEQLASRHERDLQAFRTTCVLWGSLALVLLLLGMTTTQLFRSKALASQQAELEREIDERIRAEDRLRKAQQSNIRRQRLHVLGEMAAGVAHDVNNSLSPISIYSSLIRTNDYSKKEIKQFAQTIEDCVTDAALLIQRLHPFHRKSFEGWTEVNVAEIVAQVTATVRAQIEGRPVVVEEKSDSGTFVCSAPDVREVLLNLTNNAIDAVGDAGRITIRAKLGEEALVLEVQDDGIGMDEETRSSCLYAFFSTKEEHGSGLGLATTKAVVESSGGSIEIESEIGVGTLFRISIPPATRAETSTESLALVERPQWCRILVVDDNEATRVSTQFLLESMGHIVSSCNGADRALQLLSGGDIDLLITDYKMPVVNGFELCQTVRIRYPRVFTIIMTGFEEPGLREACDSLLAKPISMNEVKAAIGRAQLIQRIDGPESPGEGHRLDGSMPRQGKGHLPSQFEI